MAERDDMNFIQRLIDDGMDPKDIEGLIASGRFNEARKVLDRKSSMARKLAERGAPQGRRLGNDRIFVSANPLEFLGAGAEKYVGGKQLEGYDEERETNELERAAELSRILGGGGQDPVAEQVQALRGGMTPMSGVVPGYSESVGEPGDVTSGVDDIGANVTADALPPVGASNTGPVENTVTQPGAGGDVANMINPNADRGATNMINQSTPPPPVDPRMAMAFAEASRQRPAQSDATGLSPMAFLDAARQAPTGGANPGAMGFAGAAGGSDMSEVAEALRRFRAWKGFDDGGGGGG